jgi:hypothetical protein
MPGVTVLDRLRARPENAAAIVNALIVVVGPIALMAVVSALPDTSDTSVTVRPPGFPTVGHYVREAAMLAMTFSPFGLVAGWRTFVHAKRWLSTGEKGWQGVAEAAALGFAGAVLVLLPGILSRPLEAPPYVLVYGGLALLVGLIVGTVLRMTALLVLWICTNK